MQQMMVVTTITHKQPMTDPININAKISNPAVDKSSFFAGSLLLSSSVVGQSEFAESSINDHSESPFSHMVNSVDESDTFESVQSVEH